MGVVEWDSKADDVNEPLIHDDTRFFLLREQEKKKAGQYNFFVACTSP